MKGNDIAQSDMMIMDDSVYHVSYNQELVGIQIHDPALFRMQCVMFDNLRATL